MPICTQQGTVNEGWRWKDTGALILKTKCAGQTAQCRYTGTRSEGWYAAERIAWAFCADVDCASDAQCDNGFRCVGIPHDGSWPYGKCRSTTTPEGDGATCSATVPCLPGLGCTLLPSGATEGICRPSWMFQTYSYTHTPPANSVYVVAYGLASVPVDVVVSGELAVTNPADWNLLTLTLKDPNGTVNTVCTPGTKPCSAAALAAGIVTPNSGDDLVNGRWTLAVTKRNGTTVTKPKIIKVFTLALSSRWD